MEMNRGRLVAKLVDDIDNHSVPNSRLDQGQGPLSIDSNDRSRVEAIRIANDPTNSEIISSCIGAGKRKQHEATTNKKIGEGQRHCSLCGGGLLLEYRENSNVVSIKI